MLKNATEYYVDSYESDFSGFMKNIADLHNLGSQSAVGHVVQRLVNSYHELGREIGPITTPNFSVLLMLISLYGCTLEHSGVNEDEALMKQMKNTSQNNAS